MNLRWVHAVLIMFSAALAVVFGVWSLGHYRQDAGVGSLLTAVVAFATAVGLIAYDSWFLRRTRSLR